MGWGFYGGLLLIFILLAIIGAVVSVPPNEDSYLDDDDWPDHPAHSGA